MSAASHNRYQICCVINGSDSVHLKSISRIASVIYAHEEEMENVGKPCLDRKNGVELSDIEIWIPSLFYFHFPNLTYFYIWYITHVDMQRERDYGYKGI